MTVFPITTLRLDQIRTDPRNVFTHQDGDLQRLTHSINEHGFLSPVVVDAASHDAKTDTYQLVGGEARAEAAAVSTAPDGRRYPTCCKVDYFHRVCQKRGICERTRTEPAAPAA